jgi:hypothetical protein
MPLLLELSGKRFGKWLVVRRAEGFRRWTCRCDCGRVVDVLSSALISGASTGCRPCFDGRGHGMSSTRAYKIWAAMIRRCNGEMPNAAHKYQGRGIRVCERWLIFENFHEDMGQPPTGHSIDRIDNDRGYEPGNCRWATQTTQQRNRTNNHRLTLNGETKTLVEWSESQGIHPMTLRNRIVSGWPVERALLTPARTKRPKIQNG